MKIGKRIKLAGQLAYRAVKWGSKPPRDPLIASWFGIEDNDTGIVVTEHTAMQLSAVWSAVRLLSKAVAMLPLMVYKRLPKQGKERATNHSLYDILHTQPNNYQTPLEFKELMQANLLLRGNGYAEIVPSGGKAVAELIPRHPDRIRPFWAPDGRRAYDYQPLDGPARVILQDEMFHLVGFSFDGLKGIGPIEYNRRTIGVPMAAEKYGARFFKNDGHPGVILEHPGKLSEDARQNLREEWEERHMGVSKSHRPTILQEGMELKELTVKPEDAQFLQTRKFGVTDIARIFEVPPHMIADLEKATFSNIVEMSLEFVIYSLGPWLVRWEEAVKRDLLTSNDKKTYFAEFLVDALLRGNIKDRYAAYSTARQWGWMSVNDIRSRENMNPVDGGDTYLVPLNMVPAKQNRTMWENNSSELLQAILKSAVTENQNGQLEPIQEGEA